MEEFIAAYIWKTMKYNGTIGFCYSEDLLVKIIKKAIEDFNAGKEWEPFRPQDL